MRKIRRILFEIKHRLHFHNPKMLFCTHRYSICGEETNKYGIFISYRCNRCGKCVTMQCMQFNTSTTKSDF